MSASRPTTVLALFALLGFVSFGGCAPEDASSTDEIACASTDGCPLGQVCILGSRECSILTPEDQPCSMGKGVCQPEPANRVTGLFRCQVVSKGDPVPDATSSFIIVNVGAKRYPITAAALCTLVDDPLLGAVVELSFLSRNTVGASLYIDVSVDFSIDSLSRTVSLGRPSVAFPLGAGVIYGQDADRHILVENLLGVTDTGTIVLDTIPKHGSFLTGYLDAALVPGRGSPNLGGNCPGGLADCGDGRLFCNEYLVGSDTHRACVKSGKCATDADCVEFAGAACITHNETTLIVDTPTTAKITQCMKTCSTDADCESPLRCTALQTGHPKACY